MSRTHRATRTRRKRPGARPLACTTCGKVLRVVDPGTNLLDPSRHTAKVATEPVDPPDPLDGVHVRRGVRDETAVIDGGWLHVGDPLRGRIGTASVAPVGLKVGTPEYQGRELLEAEHVAQLDAGVHRYVCPCGTRLLTLDQVRDLYLSADGHQVNGVVARTVARGPRQTEKPLR